ncbi:MAG: hypothetical protein AMJ54_06150 [Deltaproteobacteria bacterium SG8_13]|nr:MAG: hypothetical protein AMJ54_06150 [Deltaproteobacteria bacterium SG8_13]
MNILYGVQATGNGHISRSREVVSKLKKLGHNVRVVFSGRAADELTEVDEFEPYTVYAGLTFQTRKGKIRVLRTAARLNLPGFYRDIFSFDTSDIDLVVTDFEPISARVARRSKIPSIGIGHQYAFVHRIPMAGANPVSRWVLTNFAPVDIPIGLHWHHFGFPILPPIIPDHLRVDRAVDEKKILVYLPFESLSDVTDTLEAIPTHHFYIYGSGKIDQATDRGHLHLRPFSRQGFLNDLEECSGVVCNAGFELASEALHIGKKLLVKPLKGQPEQLSNALAISKLGLGGVMNHLDAQHIGRWLQRPADPPVTYPDVARILANWLAEGRWEDLDGLARIVWQQTGRQVG